MRPGRGATSSQVSPSVVLTFLSARPRRGAGLASCCRRRFYPHAPGGARQEKAPGRCRGQGFLSARPGRGATSSSQMRSFEGKCFYPHAPGGARPMAATLSWLTTQFLSARPGRGATPRQQARRPAGRVSIRTPRAGRDTSYCTDAAIWAAVSIRTPRAGRDALGLEIRSNGLRFLSARPGRGATPGVSDSTTMTSFLSARPGRGATLV